MSAFDKVIGYESIKNELMQVVDVIRDLDRYKALGARVPNGILLSGAPGLGKTMMARAFIEDCGLKSYEVKRTATTDDFIDELNRTFEMAVTHAPCIVLLDDMDKFANSDDRHPNAAEFVAVQTCLDKIKDEEVYVIATINEDDCLPESLLRAGRFDRKIEIEAPDGDDAVAIIRNYLKNKPVADDINYDDLARMHDAWSCAELEKSVNEAAIFAGYEKCDRVHMSHIVRATLRQVYDSCDVYKRLPEEVRAITAIHEAGHALVAEITGPSSVGMVSILNNGECEGGFTHVSGNVDSERDILISLAGKAACEIMKPGQFAIGCSSDVRRASKVLYKAYDREAQYGFNGRAPQFYEDNSDVFRVSREAVVKVELDRYLNEARRIIDDNLELFNALVRELTEKETLLHSDIQRIKGQGDKRELVIEVA